MPDSHSPASSGRVFLFQLARQRGFPIRDVSSNIQEICGFPRHELIGQPLSELVMPAYRDRVLAEIEASEPLHQTELPLRTRDGATAWLAFDASLALSLAGLDDGNSILYRHAVDATQLRQTRQELERFSSVIEQSPSAIAIHDARGMVEYVNPKYLADTGFCEIDVLGHQVPIIEDDRRDLSRRREALDAIGRGERWRGELKYVRKNGEVRWGLVSLTPILDRQGEVSRYVSMIEDITDLKESQQKLEQMAFSDPLTELPNRRRFLERLQYAVEISRRGESMAALFYLDLDSFKQVNDSLGHDAGDRVLETVARRLRGRLRSSDLVSRIGGDEFTILLLDVKNRKTCARIAEDLLKSVARPIRLDRGRASRDVTASIGITLIPLDSVEADRLMENADQALYRAKDQGRNRFLFFSDLKTAATA